MRAVWLKVDSIENVEVDMDVLKNVDVAQNMTWPRIL